MNLRPFAGGSASKCLDEAHASPVSPFKGEEQRAERFAEASAHTRVLRQPVTRRTINIFSEDQVVRTPRAVAVVLKTNMTYADLNRRADELAEHLRA
jgi:hypothetical protein